MTMRCAGVASTNDAKKNRRPSTDRRLRTSKVRVVHLIALIAIPSAALALANVSVTDDVVVPVPRDEFHQINDPLGGTWSIYDSTTGEPAAVLDYIVEEPCPR